MPVLPLEKLVYGSDDGERTVHSNDTTVNATMRAAGNRLGLTEHGFAEAAEAGFPPVPLSSAGDVEVHRGTDTRNYLLDLARAFPAESPLDTPHLPRSGQSVFFRLLRPELLQIRRALRLPPLSPDALAGWGHVDRETFDQRARDATRHLVNDIIPAFATHLSLPATPALTEPVSEAVHSKGINIRYTHTVIVTPALDSSGSK